MKRLLRYASKITLEDITLSIINIGVYTLKITVEDAVGLKKEVTKMFDVR